MVMTHNWPSPSNSQDIRLEVLPEQDTTCAQKLFHESHPIIKNGYDSKKYCFNSQHHNWEEPSKVTSPLLLEESITLLKQHNFNFDTQDFALETHSYYVNNQEVDSPFALHQDDYGATRDKVVTIIWYLRKDDTINGGNLHYSSTDCNLKDTQLLNITNNMIVMFTGNLWHVPEICTGVGYRQLVSIQFKDLARQTKSPEWSIYNVFDSIKKKLTFW
jgi:hypothetical protein